MKIPQDEIDTVKQYLFSISQTIPTGNNPDVPLAIMANPYPGFVWLKYHPSLSLGGTIGYFKDEHEVVIYDCTLKTLTWFNKVIENEKETSGWHPITSDREEIIAPVG